MTFATVEKFKRAEERIAGEKGSFALFALLLRVEASGVASTSASSPLQTERWDVVLSARWLGKGSKADLDYIIAEIRKAVGTKELRGISRVAIAEPSSPLVRAFNAAIKVEHGTVHFQNNSIFGIHLEDAFVITSKGPNGLGAKQQPTQ